MVNLKKQNQNRPSAGNPKLESLILNELKVCYLKKQTQFFKGQNDVKSILTMVYGDYNGLRQRITDEFRKMFANQAALPPFAVARRTEMIR